MRDLHSLPHHTMVIGYDLDFVGQLKARNQDLARQQNIDADVWGIGDQDGDIVFTIP